MKQLKYIFALFIVMSATSCIHVHDHGPRGLDGNAYFGIDYHYAPPYSYWDNNPRIPENPYLGEFYLTDEGIYDFEYFINPFDYWYGTYTIYRHYGTAGGPYGEPGIDGCDTHLMLFCDPNGWSEQRFDAKDNVEVTRDKDRLQVKIQDGEHEVIIEMRKTDILERPTSRAPKWTK